MSSLLAVLRELAGLFVDDGSLALQVVAVVLIAGICSLLLPSIPWATGGILLLGCIGVLIANVTRAAGAD